MDMSYLMISHSLIRGLKDMSSEESVYYIVQDGEEDRLKSGAQPASLVESSTFPQTTSDHLGRMIYCKPSRNYSTLLYSRDVF